MEHHFIEYKKSKLHYTKQGAQADVLICFHGYGWNCYNFETVMPELLECYTVFSFDLFEHGESEWHELHEFFIPDFVAIFRVFFERESVTSFSIMGYSLGGRWATSLLNAFEKKVKTLYLIAADGLQRGTIIDLLANTGQTNKIITHIIHHPSLMFAGIRMGYLTGFINKEMMQFYMNKNNTKEKRELILKRIRLCKNLFVPKHALIEKIRSNEIKLHLFYGSRDFVMPLILTSTLTRTFGKSILHKINDDHMLIIKPLFKEVLTQVLVEEKNK